MYHNKNISARINNKPIRVRVSDEAYNKLVDLKKKFPKDYKTNTDVIRAGIIHLHKWKTREPLTNEKQVKVFLNSIKKFLNSIKKLEKKSRE